MPLILIAMLALFPWTSAASAAETEPERFAVYYSDKAPVEQFERYQLLVLDSRYHPPLGPLVDKNKKLLGYISLGEAEKMHPYYDMLKKQGLLLQENKNWKGSQVIDIRSPVWQKTVIEEIIPAVLADGFEGVFFDTLDSPLDLERTKPQRFHGMSDAAVQLIEAVRMHYPSMPIMVNRGYPVLSRIAPYINMALGESVLGDYDFDKKTYIRVKDSDYRQQLAWLEEARRVNPQLKIYTLDYANTKDRKAIADIYRQQRANQFIPYVTTIGLDQLVDEQGGKADKKK